MANNVAGSEWGKALVFDNCKEMKRQTGQKDKLTYCALACVGKLLAVVCIIN